MARTLHRQQRRRHKQHDELHGELTARQRPLSETQQYVSPDAPRGIGRRSTEESPTLH
ncbi:MAG: hypothetical protein IJ219_10430 [Bacteroidaceae bacterium]|nr:hypothetical protein [Bacteroidaceae bacterium]MBQ9169408.1 hypothetical protein [Bacteroidaceae bacterium]MBQ9171430.1 hypothetical protein [Bacteroidaceae bacterium]MBQ9295324.1 hypothetical protein [Bacteroidaceae bacterium]